MFLNLNETTKLNDLYYKNNSFSSLINKTSFQIIIKNSVLQIYIKLHTFLKNLFLNLILFIFASEKEFYIEDEIHYFRRTYFYMINYMIKSSF